MPATLADDATQWLRARGAPLTARNLNAAQAFLAANQDQRPSYAPTEDGTDSIDRVPEGIQLAFTDGEKVPLDTGDTPEPVMPGRKPSQGTQPVLPGRKPTPPSADDESAEPMPDAESGPGEPPAMRGDSINEPNPLYNEDRSTGALGTATAVGAGVGAAASLAAELKKAYDADGSAQTVRDRFAKNIGSRVANAVRGESDGPLPKGVRPTMQDYQITAIDSAVKSIKDGDMKAAEKWLSYLSLEDQKALRSSLAQAPEAAHVPPTAVQKGMRSVFGQPSAPEMRAPPEPPKQPAGGANGQDLFRAMAGALRKATRGR